MNSIDIGANQSLKNTMKEEPKDTEPTLEGKLTTITNLRLTIAYQIGMIARNKISGFRFWLFLLPRDVKILKTSWCIVKAIVYSP